MARRSAGPRRVAFDVGAPGTPAVSFGGSSRPVRGHVTSQPRAPEEGRDGPRPDAQGAGLLAALGDGGRRPVRLGTNPLRGIDTYLVSRGLGTGREPESLVVRVPIADAAAVIVEREARVLVEMRRRRLGAAIERTIPRHAGTSRFDGRLVAFTSEVSGRPMRDDDRGWLQLARPWVVGHHFRQAEDWLTVLWQASGTGSYAMAWAAPVLEGLQERWAGHPDLAAALERLSPAAERLDGLTSCRAVVHGDFWHANILLDPVEERSISGVVSWYDGDPAGWPLRDPVRFALRYSHSLSRSLLPQRPLLGRDARETVVGGASGVRLALLGRGWLTRSVRTFLQGALQRLEMPAERWWDAAVVGIAEIAAAECDPRLAAEYLRLLARLPAPPNGVGAAVLRRDAAGLRHS